MNILFLTTYAKQKMVRKQNKKVNLLFHCKANKKKWLEDRKMVKILFSLLFYKL